MSKEIWLSIYEVCELTGEIKETVRRKCKRGEYVSTFEKDGKFKKYFISLESLPEKFKQKYYKTKDDNKDSKFYKKAPAWAKKQAEKYIELIDKTKEMKHQEIKEFLAEWNETNPDKKSSYPSLCKAKAKFEQFGKDALLSRKGLKEDEYRIKPEYYEYYKNLYLSPEAPSIYNCWLKTLFYAMDKDKIEVGDFPCEKTFDRHLKKDVSKSSINFSRRKHEFVFAKDLSNVKTNEYWYIESYQFDFPIKHKQQNFYPWITVVRDVKTSKWLGFFVYHDKIEYDHILQAMYYTLIKYGSPKEIFIRNMKFSSYLNGVGKTKKTNVEFPKFKLSGILFSLGIHAKFEFPKSLNIKPIVTDFRKLEIPNSNTNIFEFKNIIEEYIENVINKKPFRSEKLTGKTPEILWNETYSSQPLPNKDDLKFLCKRNKNAIQIGRNGIFDSVTSKTYWSESVCLNKGRKIFFRRDLYSNDIIAIYNAKDESLFGYAEYSPPVPALARTPEELAIVKEAIRRKRWNLKQGLLAIQPTREISLEEKIANYKAAYNSDKPERKPNPKIHRLSNTRMDEAIRKHKEQERIKKERDAWISQMAEDLL